LMTTGRVSRIWQILKPRIHLFEAKERIEALVVSVLVCAERC